MSCFGACVSLVSVSRSAQKSEWFGSCSDFRRHESDGALRAAFELALGIR